MNSLGNVMLALLILVKFIYLFIADIFVMVIIELAKHREHYSSASFVRMCTE